MSDKFIASFLCGKLYLLDAGTDMTVALLPAGISSRVYKYSIGKLNLKTHSSKLAALTILKNGSLNLGYRSNI